MTTDLIQLLVIGISLCLTTLWAISCFRKLRTMYRSGKNGILEHLAWEKLLIACIYLMLQALWFVSTLRLYRYAPDTYEGVIMKSMASDRAFTGSLIILLLITLKYWSWTRIESLDNERRRSHKKEVKEAGDCE